VHVALAGREDAAHAGDVLLAEAAGAQLGAQLPRAAPAAPQQQHA